MFPVTPTLAASVALPPAAPAEGLILYGILGNGVTGSAIIGEADGDQRLVRVGRQIRPGVILKSLAATSVVLQRNGRHLKLWLIDGGQSRLAALDTNDAIRSVRATKSVTPIQASMVATVQAMTAIDEGNGAAGFRVETGTNVPIFQAAGIRAGDVILTVNGRPFDSTEKANTLLRQQSTGATIIFGIERNGRNIGLSAEL